MSDVRHALAKLSDTRDQVNSAMISFMHPASEELVFVPRERHLLAKFGKNDDTRLKRHLLMLAAFLEGRNPHTKRSYRVALKQFFDRFDWVCPEDVTVAHAVAFKKWLLERGVSDATAYQRLSALSSYFDFLRKPSGATEQPLVSSNPFDIVPRSDIKPTPYGRSTPMEWSTFERLINAIPSDPLGLRDLAILTFFAYTGRRRAEVASLRVRDLNLKSSPRSYTCKVKGGAIKSFELPEICYDAIRAYWIAAGRLDSIGPDSGVFTASRTCPLTKDLDPEKPLSTRSMNHLLTSAAKRAGVSLDEVKLHGIRHMAARDLDRAGVRLQEIQAFLGHANPNTTAIYLQRLAGPAPSHVDKLMKIRQAGAALVTKRDADTSA